MDLYVLDVDGNGKVGEPRKLHNCQFIYDNPVVSNQGEVIVVPTPAIGDATHFRLLAFDARGRELGELWDGMGSTLVPRIFSPSGDLRLLGVSNASGANRPFIWDLQTGERTDLKVDELEGEVQVADWSEDGRQALLVHISKAVQQLYLYDLDERSLTRLDHPGGTYAYTSWPYFALDGEIYADWQDSTHPSRVVALDAGTGAYRRTVLSAGEVPPGHGWRSVSFTSPGVNGTTQEIQAWLGLPDGEGPFPTILNTHGGPTFALTDLFSPSSQMWLDHGYAYLSVNYRGSTTFGREFEEQIRGDLGHWEVEDMVAARDWLLEQGIAQPDKIVLQGASYGGYLTLMALGKRPDLSWAGGLALVPVVDWKMNHEDSAGVLQAYDEMLLGGKPDEVPERFTAASPLTYVDRVSAPVLIIAGRNDTRCPSRPIEVYVERLRALGKPVEVEWFEAGHGSLVVEQEIEQAAMQLRFAHKLVNSQDN
jgi:dipeptidyl aminopeptidase/acylaminoacyl peptidase